MEIILNDDFDSVVSVAEVPSHFNPEWQLKINHKGYLKKIDDLMLSSISSQRQKLPKTYFRNGAIYICKVDIIKKYNNIYGDNTAPYIMPFKSSINIDSYDDLELAQFLANKK